MKVSIYKSNGTISRERVKVRVFTDNDAMHQFLNKQSDNSWKINNGSFPVKSGVFARAGGEWHNIKNLDPSILAHI
jgi:hypothetical protein